MPQQYRYYKAFSHLPLTAASVALASDLEWCLTGTNAADADVTVGTSPGVTVATHGANNDTSVIIPHTTAGQSLLQATTWNTDALLGFRARFVAVSTTNCIFECGYRATFDFTTTSDNNKVAFRVTNTASAGLLTGIWSIGGVNYGTASSTFWAAQTYDVQFIPTINRTIRIYCNGVLVTETGILTANTALGKPYIGIKASGEAAAKSFRLLSMGVSVGIPDFP